VHSDTNDIRRCRSVNFTDIKPEFDVPEDASCHEFEIHKVPDHVTVPEENNDIHSATEIAEDIVKGDVHRGAAHA